MAAEIGHLSGVKAMPVKIKTVDRHLALRRRRFNLRPVGIGMTQKVLHRPVEVLRSGNAPSASRETVLAEIAMAFTAIFVEICQPSTAG